MIAELNKTGGSVRDIAKEYGISDAIVYIWVELHTSSKSAGLT